MPANESKIDSFPNYIFLNYILKHYDAICVIIKILIALKTLIIIQLILLLLKLKCLHK